jgi:hypothetical protein
MEDIHTAERSVFIPAYAKVLVDSVEQSMLLTLIVLDQGTDGSHTIREHWVCSIMHRDPFAASGPIVWCGVPWVLCFLW